MGHIHKFHNKRDVEVELAVKEKLKQFPVPYTEWRLYFLDQKINDTGIKVDMELVRSAIHCDSEFRRERLIRAQSITGLDNPNSVAQLLGWLREKRLRGGEPWEGLHARAD